MTGVVLLSNELRSNGFRSCMRRCPTGGALRRWSRPEGERTKHCGRRRQTLASNYFISGRRAERLCGCLLSDAGSRCAGIGNQLEPAISTGWQAASRSCT